MDSTASNKSIFSCRIKSCVDECGKLVDDLKGVSNAMNKIIF